MTHTKEPWAVVYYTCRADANDVKYERERPLKRGETRRDLKAGDALWRQPLSIGDIAPDHCHWAGNHLSCDEETAERVCAMWNALAGIPDPAAFVQAARGVVEALERCAMTAEPKRGEVLIHATNWFALLDTLQTFREQMGELP